MDDHSIEVVVIFAPEVVEGHRLVVDFEEMFYSWGGDHYAIMLSDGEICRKADGFKWNKNLTTLITQAYATYELERTLLCMSSSE
jgi:hypothetical protein